MPRKLLALEKLPTTWNEMSEEERRAWCESLAAVMKKNLDSETKTKQQGTSTSSE
jgi:hypothetical protein